MTAGIGCWPSVSSGYHGGGSFKVGPPGQTVGGQEYVESTGVDSPGGGSGARYKKTVADFPAMDALLAKVLHVKAICSQQVCWYFQMQPPYFFLKKI